MTDRRPLLAVTLGDPGGVGPEIAAKALALKGVYEICRPLIIGTVDLIKNALAFSGIEGISVAPLADPAQGRYGHGQIEVLEAGNFSLSELKHKTVTAAQGRVSFEFVAKAIELALAGQVDGTVTGPINKAAINAAGFHYSGHTEIYAEKTATRDYAMMLADGNFRVSHVSTHVSLREACQRAKKDRIAKVIDLTAQALRRLGLGDPKIAVAGLNPHCGEDGLFGTEDDLEVRPAVAESKAAGLSVEGPIPADTVFSKMLGGQYDAVVAMYHDQGHIPTKLVGFKYDQNEKAWGKLSGVNVTLGLPIVRTSVDHGTAFGKAGEGRANPQSLIEAIAMAAQLAAPPKT
ncbi:MAG: 4-hydroxythreonine-4-phosphate dehydrogenase PdxA [Deltaproteobacteria bacterium]|jgi:4-hydroxythreonine-4-phosphate dehydrogenase|nr:4-hydroxythreonine-4-phosphate dehydrogenase PdxA [Deltaproteobacteria bacterium]